MNNNISVVSMRTFKKSLQQKPISMESKLVDTLVGRCKAYLTKIFVTSNHIK